MNSTSRRYDIDWLRVIAIFLLLIYHIAIVFQPWGVFIGFMQNSESLTGLWTAMSMVNIWRIPLLFFVSGMGVCFAMRKRNWKQLIAERTQRILIPFIFGVLVIVPLHILLWLSYYNQALEYKLTVGHLWFLGNIFAYVLLLLPFFYYLKHKPEGRWQRFLTKLFKNPLSIVLVIIPFILEAIIVNPELFTLYAYSWHGFFLGFLAFLFGYLFIYSGSTFWDTLLKWRWVYLSAAVVLFVVRYQVYDLEAPGYLLAIESVIWIYSLFGFAYRYLNHPGKALSYLSKAAYPVYIIHMVYLYLASMVILPLALTALVKFLLINLATFIACYATYELVIKRVPFMGVLFGVYNSSQRFSVPFIPWKIIKKVG